MHLTRSLTHLLDRLRAFNARPGINLATGGPRR
jgi:hypothetical protein